MILYDAGKYDVAVIGAGHAGIEAALASARLGAKTLLFTISLDAIGNMPCNPSIGGTAKGHLVRELDALGGEMGKAADATMLQMRMLNLGKGPAVHSLRMQSDRKAYHRYMKKVVEDQENLFVKQAEIVRLDCENGEVKAVVTAMGAKYEVDKAIIATGTFLRGKIFVGEYCEESGPDGMHPAKALSESLKENGINLRRFKTGTPARVLGKSLDYSKMEIQEGDENIVPFSFDTDPATLSNKLPCYITYTNLDTHKIILDNIHRSPLYGGKIEGIGPRYCPSIEDKVKRFSDKNRHQLFVEPLGIDTDEMYMQGFSSSLPEEVQVRMYHTVAGLENVQIMRTAYAIEYDCIDSTELYPTLEFKKIKGLYGAGQFNGTSGYEEAAVQGYVAGANAALAVLGREPVTFERSDSYIGTLIDDLVTKGCMDPYRMMTSRSEYRLLLRQDNADVRLMKKGYDIGLVSQERYDRFLHQQEEKEAEKERLSALTIRATDELNAMLESIGATPLTQGIKATELLKRPHVTYDCLAPFDKNRPELCRHVTEQVEIEIKYEGYIKKQLKAVEQMKKYEKISLKGIEDYSGYHGLRLEAIEKLNKIKPLNIGQASRISGVSPADISVLLIILEQKKSEGKK